MPNKKQVRNAFYFFMKEEEPKLRREGRVFPNGMADVVPICHPRWKALPEKDKERFEKMAKDYKAKMRGREGDKYRLDNTGNVLAYRTNEHTELEKRRMNEKKLIRKNWPPGLALAPEKFYFVSFQTLCQTEEGDYLPCEIAIIEYSLEKGITKHLHRFIEPGRIPTGYRFACIENSESTHQIPVEKFELADSNYLGLWNQIENFINPNGEKNEYPPLYCLGAGENYKMVEYCLDWIHAHARTGIPNRIRHVFEVESLFQELSAHVGNTDSKSLCIDRLTTSDWDYEPNTKCKYHEELEVKDCSLGIVNRFAYSISNYLAGTYGIELTENHVPMRTDLPAMTVLSPSTMPLRPNFIAHSQPQRANNYVKPQKQEALDDEYSDLRMPKQPGQYGGQYGAGEPASNFAWGSAKGGAGHDGFQPAGRGRSVQYDDEYPAMGGVNNNGFQPAGRGRAVQYEDDYPAMGGGNNYPAPMPVGRGISSAFQASMNISDRHAGRADPPPASAAPDPPLTWKQQPGNIGFQEPMGIGRGMIAKSQSNVNAPPPQFNGRPPVTGYPIKNDVSTADVEDYAPLRIPGQKAEIPDVQPVDTVFCEFLNGNLLYNPLENNMDKEDVALAPKIQIGRGTGHGYGGILEQLLKNGVKPGVPIGRGFTPEDWVDDGSLGPRRK